MTSALSIYVYDDDDDVVVVVVVLFFNVILYD